MRVSECKENQEQRILEKERCPLASGEVEMLGALIREPTLVLLIDNSDVFWFMRQKDLTYLTTANIVITLFATGHLAYSESRARLQDLYGELREGYS